MACEPCPQPSSAATVTASLAPAAYSGCNVHLVGIPTLAGRDDNTVAPPLDDVCVGSCGAVVAAFADSLELWEVDNSKWARRANLSLTPVYESYNRTTTLGLTALAATPIEFDQDTVGWGGIVQADQSTFMLPRAGTWQAMAELQLNNAGGAPQVVEAYLQQRATGGAVWANVPNMLVQQTLAPGLNQFKPEFLFVMTDLGMHDAIRLMVATDGATVSLAPPTTISGGPSGPSASLRIIRLGRTQ